MAAAPLAWQRQQLARLASPRLGAYWEVSSLSLLQVDIYDPDAKEVLYTQDLHTGSQV